MKKMRDNNYSEKLKWLLIVVEGFIVDNKYKVGEKR